MLRSVALVLPDPPATSPIEPVPTLPELVGKPPPPPVNDPAWQPRADPLRSVNLREQVEIVHREIPLTTTAINDWTVPASRLAILNLAIGNFDAPAQLADNIMLSDSRVQASLSSRLSILGRPVDFRLPPGMKDSALARECRDAFAAAWPTMANEAAMSELQRWAIMMGFGIAQILWDTTGPYAIPHPLPWHPRYTYYHWLYRCYVAITMDGQEPVMPGNASWILHAPHGDYRGWMRGALGAITPWWLARHYALRDWARYSEIHGIPIIKFKAPSVGDPYQQAAMRGQLAGLSQESVLHLPQNPPPVQSYDAELLEAKDGSWEGFARLIAQCDMEITLTLLAQTLTSSMPAEGGSSYAAARVHADVRQGLLESDARALSETLTQQLARPFAAVNFGSPDLAPRIIWDVTPYEDAKTKADALSQIASAVASLRQAGVKVADVRKVIADIIPGLDVGALEEIEPLAVQTQAEKAKAAPARSGAEGRARFADYRARFDPNHGGSPRTRIAAEHMSEELREALATDEAEQIRRGAHRVHEQLKTRWAA